MSLITLKNDDNSKPYSWRNYFTAPIEIGPKSSVSLVSAVAKTSPLVNMEDNEEFYFRIGDNPGLNPVQIGRVDLGIETWTASALVDDIKDELLTKTGQPAFSDNTDGWDCFLDTTAVDKGKITFRAEQIPLPLELPTEVWTGIPNTYFTSALGLGVNDYTRIRRTGVVAPSPAEMASGASWSEGICPRNGGHMLFKPTESGGVFPRDQKFALGATYKTATGSQLNYYQSPAGQASGASFGSIGIHMQAGALGSALAQPYINIGTGLGVGLEEPKGVAYQTIAGTPVVFCIEWKDPYSMLIKYSLDYAPAVPATNFQNATWTTMYDMTNDGGDKFQFPTYLDNLSPMVQMRGLLHQVEVRGTLTTTEGESGKWDWIESGYGRDDDELEYSINEDEGNDAFVGVYPDIYIKKKVQILGDTIEEGFTDLERDSWDAGIIGYVLPTEFSKRIGFTDPVIELVNDDATYKSYSAIANNLPLVSNYVPTIHIQLTNLAIKSKNGIVSNNVKDIAVIPLFDENPIDDTLHYIAPYENRINLNNLETLNLNELDILITGDENTPATFLTHHTAIVLKIHKGEV